MGLGWRRDAARDVLAGGAALHQQLRCAARGLRLPRPGAPPGPRRGSPRRAAPTRAAARGVGRAAAGPRIERGRGGAGGLGAGGRHRGAVGGAGQREGQRGAGGDGDGPAPARDPAALHLRGLRHPHGLVRAQRGSALLHPALPRGDLPKDAAGLQHWGVLGAGGASGRRRALRPQVRREGHDSGAREPGHGPALHADDHLPLHPQRRLDPDCALHLGRRAGLLRDGGADADGDAGWRRDAFVLLPRPGAERSLPFLLHAGLRGKSRDCCWHLGCILPKSASNDRANRTGRWKRWRRTTPSTTSTTTAT